MPEHFKRAIVRSKERANTAQPCQKNQTIDLTALTDQEEKIIQAVILKDELERRILDAKISEVRKEIQEIRKAGALTAGDDQNTICARCKFKFMPFALPWADNGQRCLTCKFRVCAKCCTKQPNGSWLCILCFKYRQEKLLTGEWASKGHSNSLCGSDLLRASLRDRKLRREKSSSQRSPTPKSSSSAQNLRNKEVSGQPVHKIKYIRQMAQSSVVRSDSDRSLTVPPEGTATERHFPKLQMIGSTPLAVTVSSDDAVVSVSMDSPHEDCEKATEAENIPGDDFVDKNNSNEADYNVFFPAQNDHAYSSNKLLPALRDHKQKRADLTRNISVSEQNLYYDEEKQTYPHMPQLASQDSRSISSLCSDYSLNPKYRSMKRTSGSSELELFRKRGERYSLRRKKALENETSQETDNSKPDIVQDTAVTSSSENQQMPAEVKNVPTPHWHEILRMQSVVDSLAKPNKTPAAVPAPVLIADSSVDYNTFPLMNPKTKTAILKNEKYLTPNNSKDDSSSSQESISVYVASYMSPTQDFNPDNIFTSTPNGSKPTTETSRGDSSSGFQVSPVSSNKFNSSPKGRRSNQSNDSRPSSDLPRKKNTSLPGLKSSRRYFNIVRSISWSRPKGTCTLETCL